MSSLTRHVIRFLLGRVSQPRLGHKFPSFSDREALCTSAHSLFHSIKHSTLYLHLQYLSLASTCSSRSICQSPPNFNTRVSLENFPPQCATSFFSQTFRSRTIDWASAREAMMHKDLSLELDQVILYLCPRRPYHVEVDRNNLNRP